MSAAAVNVVRPNLPVGQMGLMLFGNASVPTTVHLDVFLDLQCPFSRKAWRTLRQLPVGVVDDSVNVRAHWYIQPWHGFSHFLTKAALAVGLQGDNEMTLRFCDSVYEHQAQFADDDSKAPAAYYDELEVLAAAVDADTAAFRREVSSALGHSGDVTRTIKFLTRHGRQNGILSTPTFLVNGIEYGAASSSWSVHQWVELFASLRAA